MKTTQYIYFANRLLAIIALLVPMQYMMAQNTLIKGVVDDGHKPLPFATVWLRGITDTAYRERTYTDSVGYFQFIAPSHDKYIIQASHLNYISFISDTIVPDINKAYQDLLKLTLEKDTGKLQEVVVKSRKQVFESDMGKLIFNVQNSSLSTGQTAFDILKKLPGVTVDQNETIFLRGSSGVNVLIDGKMTYLSGKQLTTYLKGMSAEDLSKIELNMAPSAEFDAAGNAGIINIVPKKNRKKGYAIDLRSGITKGTFWMPATNIAFSQRSGKLDLYGSLDFKTPHSHWESLSGNSIHASEESTEIRRKNSSDYKINYYTWRAGAEWQLLPKHRLGVDYMGYLDDYKSSNQPIIENYNASEDLISTVLSVNNIQEPYHYDAVNLNYRFDIDTMGKKITADAHYTSYRNFSDGKMTTREFDAFGNLTGMYDLLSHQPGFIRIRSAQADADLPFAKFSLKAGLKYAEVTNDNGSKFDSLIDGRIIPSEEMSNHFVYQERIAAAYISASKKINKTSLDLGLRMEQTDAEGHTLKQDVDNQWSYARLFPSFSIEQEIKNGDKINFSVSRRINRPSYSDLNPVRWYTDQYYYYAGNPDLLPEMAWIFAGIYSLKHKYIFTLSYNHSSNYINRKLFRDDNGIAISSRSANLGTMQQLSLVAALPLQVTTFWELQFTSDLNYMTYPVSQLEGERRLSIWYSTFTAQQQFRLPADIKMDLFTQYATPALRGFYKTKSYFYTDVGLKRSFFTDRLDVQFTLNDIFNTNRYQGVSQSNITNYWYNDKPDTRRISISLHYHLGSELVKTNKKKTEEQERL